MPKREGSWEPSPQTSCNGRDGTLLRIAVGHGALTPLRITVMGLQNTKQVIHHASKPNADLPRGSCTRMSKRVLHIPGMVLS